MFRTKSWFDESDGSNHDWHPAINDAGIHEDDEGPHPRHGAITAERFRKCGEI
jgi:hypothetical protein